MISHAIFPCAFTDGARIIGELSYTLNSKVYTDWMLLDILSTELDTDQATITKTIFGSPYAPESFQQEKIRLISKVKSKMAEVAEESEDSIYYGLFSLLPECNTANRILITASEPWRLRRGISQEGLPEQKVLSIVKQHDRRARNWAEFLFGCRHDNPELYDTVITCDSQELLDIIAHLFMLYQNDSPNTSLATC